MEGIQLSFFDTEPEDDRSRLREILMRGSGYEGGRLRIYAAERLLDADRFAEFLADEFNVGGHSIKNGFVDYNGRGMVVREWRINREVKYNWRQIAREYRDMISLGVFPGEKEIRLYQDARKAGKGAPAPRMHWWGGDPDD